MRPTGEILETLGRADLAIFQPLGPQHGDLGGRSLRHRLGSRAIAFPRLFNSGIASLCLAPLSTEAPCRAYGSEPVVQLLQEGLDRAEVKRRYWAGEIPFDQVRRFEECVEEIRRREGTTEVKLADYIAANRRSRRLYLTHNHPASALLLETCRQIGEIAGLQLDIDKLQHEGDDNLGRLPRGYAPISPLDAQVLGYEFGYDPDWERAGGLVIDYVADLYEGRDPRPEIPTALTGAPTG
jgi:hypothetical protein